LPVVFGLPCLGAGFAVFVALLQGFALLAGFVCLIRCWVCLGAGFCLAFRLLAVFCRGLNVLETMLQSLLLGFLGAVLGQQTYVLHYGIMLFGL
jgi:hypothetical protein